MFAQLSVTDYERALSLQEKYRGLVQHLPDDPHWIEGTDRFIYRRTITTGHEFVLVDAERQTREPAFDHARLADVLSKEFGEPVKADALPLERYRISDGGTALEFARGKERWRCDLSAYTCAKRPGREESDDDDGGYDSTPAPENGVAHSVVSPDGNWQAFVENYNVAVRSTHTKPADVNGQTQVLSEDGSEDNYYAISTLVWSPDSKRLAAYKIRPGYKREVHYVESSPADQLQPKYSSMVYPKAGDTLSLYQPVLFDVAEHHEVPIENSLFPSPYEMLSIAWWKDSRGFTFEYNQRGHQLYRLIEVDAKTGSARTLIEENSDTFINYEPLTSNQFDHGKYYREDIDDGKQIIWASERDGWEHLYLFDGHTGGLIRQITHGNWVVRAVDRVDEKSREIYFEASGMDPDEDPYFVHAYRVGFDGAGLTPMSPVKANHVLSYSEDGKYYIDTYSRIDLAPVMELHRASDASVVMTVETADDAKLKAAGWQPSEPFHAAGRDGKTQIWGVIHRPLNFDPAKKYPVIEDIYAGPQGSFVPKSFSVRVEPLTALGFVVVQIDGMGTNNRSRAFHDVAWHNLKDAGFADRILWHKAVAASYPWYDISRVGVFGTSAGGQSAMGALLFHPEFYKVAVANSGSHDNRMDKIWWNEQWMGWPVGPWYSESSNADNAWRLQGKLMLVMGEMDKNVDPATTLQVVDRLIKAGKDFDLLFVPGGGHGAGGRYGERKLMDFFVRNLRNEPTPDWNVQPDQSLVSHVSY
ncbi:MAG TPA: DPP IV N-terminal domain-containing protein [Terracidiphilus sp.]|nr:DPP IV N-terminal domain-containing protein [Terracidiphilus sp.]